MTTSATTSAGIEKGVEEMEPLLHGTNPVPTRKGVGSTDTPQRGISCEIGHGAANLLALVSQYCQTRNLLMPDLTPEQRARERIDVMLVASGCMSNLG